MSDYDEHDFREIATSPTLDFLLRCVGSKGKSIFNVEFSSDRNILRMTEACDGYFYMDLDKRQVGLIVDAFKNLYEQMGE